MPAFQRAHFLSIGLCCLLRSPSAGLFWQLLATPVPDSGSFQLVFFIFDDADHLGPFLVLVHMFSIRFAGDTQVPQTVALQLHGMKQACAERNNIKATKANVSNLLDV